MISLFRRAGSLESRVFSTLGPVVAVLFLAMGVVVWVMAGRAARQMLTDRIRSSAEVAASSVPFTLETGQNLILQLAEDTDLVGTTRDDLVPVLEEHLAAVPYFEQFVLLDANGRTLAGVPVPDLEGLQPNQRELDAIERAISGLPLQFFSIPPLEHSSDAAQLSFVAAVERGGVLQGVLLGRTRLSTNPFLQPALDSLSALTQIGAQALLLDGEGRIAYTPGGAALLEEYAGVDPGENSEYEEVSPEGERRLVIYQPALGSNWAVVAILPTRIIQQTALDIALPVLGLLLVLAILAFLLLRASLRVVTNSLQSLVLESQRMAAGDLEPALDLAGEDEVGRVGEAFEEMRKSFRARLDEIERLLAVSQGVAASLDVKSQVAPILEAALASGAASARLVLRFGNGETLESYGRGAGHADYAPLDAQVADMARARPRVLLTNPARARLDFGDIEPPSAIAAFALKHQGRYLGALWLAFVESQPPSDEMMGYLESLAGQAASSAANTRLYVEAEQGRRRSEALLATTPDPVILTDAQSRLLFVNPAAGQLLGKSGDELVGLPVEEAIAQEELLSLFDTATDESRAAELHLGGGRVFYASVSPIQSDGEPLGRACVLRDISQFRQGEAMRAEFLSTVSHELRDPIELTRGYLTMLDMVGELNDKQADYVQKIGSSVEGMSRLVGSLLDLERIESAQGLQVEPFSLPEAIDEVLAEIKPRADQKQLDVRIELPEAGLPLLEADRTLLQRALYNLLDNAVRHSPNGAPVQMTVSRSPDAITFAVQDQGPGIAPMDLPQVFERLSPSGDRGAQRRGGLGLSIVKSIFERHSGRVWAESELGRGSAFYGQMPLKPGG